MKAEIPSTYHQPNQDPITYRLSIASMLSNCPESPLTPGVSNFGLHSNNSPFTVFPSKFNHCTPQPNHFQQQRQQLPLELPRFASLQISPNNSNRLQSLTNQNDKNYLAPNSMLMFQLPTPTPASGMAPFTRTASSSSSPVKSTHSPNTSGYESFSSSATSLEQSYAPYAIDQYQGMQSGNTGGNASARFSPENQAHALMNASRQMNDSFSFDDTLANLRSSVSENWKFAIRCDHK